MIEIEYQNGEKEKKRMSSVDEALDYAKEQNLARPIKRVQVKLVIPRKKKR